MKKRLTAILLTLVLMMGLTSFAAAEEGIPTAATFDELVAAMESGATIVEIGNTITIGENETNTLEYGESLGDNEKTITLVRSKTFTSGPMLLIMQGGFTNIVIDGAGIAAQDVAVIVSGTCGFSNVTFKNCSAGAVSVTDGVVMFENCTFEDNTGKMGAHVTNNAEAVFTQCTFNGGQAESDGGAIKNLNTLQLQNCIFSKNSTSVDSEFYSGGAVYNIGRMYAYKCTFTDNTSAQGGALYNFGDSELIECSLTNNSANIGGGINSTGTIRITDTLIYKNGAVEAAADLFTTNSITVSYNEGYVFSESPSGWYSDSSDSRKGEKLFDTSFEGAGNLVFLMESDLPAKEPDPPAVDPTPTPTPEPEPERPTVRPSSSGGHHTTAVNKPIKPTLDKAKTLYLSGYCDAVPNENITRRQVAHILYNLMSAESQKHYASNENIFIDVEDDIAIAALAKAKIVLGYDEHYRPDAYLTRGELCAILSRFSDLKSGASSFQNIEHHWARDYVNICVSNGWIADGTESDLNSYITVKDAANIIEKML